MQSAYKLKADTSEFDRKIRKSKQNLTQFASHGKLGIEGMTKAIGASLAGMVSWTAAIAGAAKVIKDVIKKNAEFEQQNATLASILGTTSDQITMLTEDAKRLGATTMYTASQVSDLQQSLARLGFTQTEIKNSTEAVLSFAAATGADLGGAADLCGAALRSFGMDAKEMSRVSSAMAVATTKSALSYEKLSNSLSTVAPVASKFGFTIEDTLALLGKLSDAGFDASSAATATRNIFLNMANTSGKLATALGRPIKSLDDLAPALAEIQAKGIDLAEMLELTDKRSVAAFATLVSGSDTLAKLRDDITDCSQALQGMVDNQMNTLHGSTLILQSAWEGLMLSFSESTGPIKSVVDGLTDLLSAWTQWRNRRNGGEAGISTFELGAESEAVEERISSLKKQGYTEEQILRGTTKRLEVINQERTAVKELYNELLRIEQLSGKEHDAQMAGWNEMFHNMYPEYNVGKDGAAPTFLMRQIASLNDKAATSQYAIDILTPKVQQQTGAGDGSEEVVDAADKLRTRILRIKNQEAKDIAAIDREKFDTEVAYENEVYRIKRESLQKQQQLYTEGDDKYIQTETAIANLDANHQARLTRLEGQMEKMGTIQPFKGIEEYVASGSMDELNGQLQKAYEELDALAVGTEAWYEQLRKVNTLKAKKQKYDEMENPTSKEDPYKNMTTNQRVGGVVGGMGAVIGGISTISSSLETLGVNVSDDFKATLEKLGAVMNIIQAINGIFTSVVTILSIIMGRQMIPFFHAGGIVHAAGGYSVPGALNGGKDTVPAILSPGELVLNRAQQVSLASQLTSGSAIASGRLSTRIKGGDIIVALDNTNRARGGSRGLYAYSK